MQIPKEEVREKIVAAAREDFLEKGFSNASMRRIAKRAQISTSNLYNYFKSKEDLFLSITDPIHREINILIEHLVRTEKAVGVEQFFNQFSQLVAKPIGELIKKHRVDFLLILDQSQGTKYETFKDRLVEALEEHILEKHYFQTNSKDKQYKDRFVFHIIATNLLEGLLEISRHYQGDEWTDYTLSALLNYHINGFSGFF
ncbi:MAG: TetR/AcrR family transcriptional regulator [Candidatus Thorarchaeota archaeon]